MQPKNFLTACLLITLLAMTASQAVAQSELDKEGATLFARVAKKIGTEKVTSFHAVYTSRVYQGGETMWVDQDVKSILPDKYLQVATYPDSEVQHKVVVNGTRGMANISSHEMVELPNYKIRKMFEHTRRELFVLASNHDSPELSATSLGIDGEIDGVACRVVEVEFKGTISRLCVDAEGKVLSQTFTGDDYQGEPGMVAVKYSDYRSVGGHTIPYEQVRSVNGVELSTSKIGLFEFNPTFDESIFEVGP